MFRKAALSLVLLAASAFAALESKVFFNYTYDLRTNAGVASSFQIQRANLKFYETFATNFTTAFLLELDTTGSVGKVDAYVLWAKEASIAASIVKGPVLDLNLTLGMQPMFSIGYQEGMWAKRYLYKVYNDQNGYVQTYDLGASLRTKFFNSNLVLNLGVYNGEGFKKLEINNVFLYNVGLGYESERFTAYVYGDYMANSKSTTASASTGDQMTFLSYAGLRVTNVFRIGAEYSIQANRAGNTNGTNQWSGVSAYAAVTPIKQLEIFGRFDYSFNQTNTLQNYAIIGGVQFAPIDPKKFAVSLTYKNTTFPGKSDFLTQHSISLDSYWGWNTK